MTDNELMTEARVALLNWCPYYACLLQRLKLNWNEKVGTAGVGVTNKGDIELTVAPTFFRNLSEKERMGLLVHEVLHLVMDHVQRGKNLNKMAANVAMDVAINQYIPENILPKGALLPEMFKFDRGLNFEQYYSELMKNSKKMQGKATLDNHEWGDKEGQSELSKDIIEDLIKESYKEARNLKNGNIPHHIEKIISDILKTSEVPWKVQLRRFFGRELSQNKQSTRTKANRRLGLKATGNKREYFPNVLIGFDQSGSVSDAQVTAFFGEIRSILAAMDEGCEIAYFDTEIVYTQKLKNRNSVAPIRKASGGTDFQCIMDYAATKKPDVLIILTDAGAPMPVRKGKFPLLWAIIGGDSASHLQGTKVFVKQE